MKYGPDNMHLVGNYNRLEPGSFVLIERQIPYNGKTAIDRKLGYFQYLEEINGTVWFFLVSNKKTYKYKLFDLKKWNVYYLEPRRTPTFKNTRENLKEYRSTKPENINPGTWCAVILDKSYNEHEAYTIQFGWFKYIEDDLAVLEHHGQTYEIELDEKFYVKKAARAPVEKNGQIDLAGLLTPKELADFQRARASK